MFLVSKAPGVEERQLLWDSCAECSQALTWQPAVLGYLRSGIHVLEAGFAVQCVRGWGPHLPGWFKASLAVD